MLFSAQNIEVVDIECDQKTPSDFDENSQRPDWNREFEILNPDDEDSETEELAYPIKEKSIHFFIKNLIQEKSDLNCNQLEDIPELRFIAKSALNSNWGFFQKRTEINVSEISAFLTIHNCLELVHQILTDRVVECGAFKGSDVSAALTRIRRASANPKVLAKECTCAPKLKGFNTFSETEVIPSDTKSNFFRICLYFISIP